LLTDPQIKWQDYLWFDDDPLSSPRLHDLDYVVDINTGHAYTKTYQCLIRNLARQILMGLQFYMDAVVSGQFTNLPVTAVWCTFRIFNHKASEQDYFWGTFGYVPNYQRKFPKKIESSQNLDMLMPYL
jgi:hypothetical protein